MTNQNRPEDVIGALLEAERDNRERVLPEVRRKIEELKAEMPEDFQKQARTAFLKDEAADAVVRVWDLTSAYEDYFNRDRVLERVLLLEEYQEEIKRVWRLLGEIRRLNGKDRPNHAEGITPEMIERARAYPFEQLHEFKRNMALCPFHHDKTPSFSLHNNRATCFGACGRTWDTIAFVMERDGLSFSEAVRRLQ